jgi:hypothetical protein
VQRELCTALKIYSAKAHAFDEQDVELASTFAAYAGVALANMHLYEAQHRVVEQLRYGRFLVELGNDEGDPTVSGPLRSFHSVVLDLGEHVRPKSGEDLYVRTYVEVAGIEPASSVASTGLLRAQLAVLFSALPVTRASRERAQPQ